VKFSSVSFVDSIGSTPAPIIIGIIVVVVMMTIITLFFYHGYLIATAKTTYEQVKHIDDDVHWDQGVIENCKNACQAMCSEGSIKGKCYPSRERRRKQENQLSDVEAAP